MSLNNKIKITRVRNLWIASALLLFVGQIARAGTDIWTGGGDGANWGDANNWNPSAVPATYDSLVFQGSVGTSPNNNLTAATNNSITFSNNASAFTLSGNTVTLSHKNTATMIGITNSSANNQTVGLNVNLDWGNYTFSSPSGTLALNGQLTASPGGIAGFAANNLTSTSLAADPSGLISGLGGAGLIYAGTSFSGLATVSGGAVVLYSGGTPIASGSIGDTAQAAPGNLVLTATPGTSTRVTYTLNGGTGNTYANSIWANGTYGNSSGNATIQIGGATDGELILGSAGGNWVGGIYASVPNTSYQKLLEVTNRFLTAGPDSGVPTPGTIVLAVNGGNGTGINIFSAITNNPSGGAVSVIKTGSGGLYCGPTERWAYTGGTYVNQGYVQTASGTYASAAMSAGPYYIAAGASMYIRTSFTNEMSISPGLGDTAASYAGALKLDGVNASGKFTVLGAPVSTSPGDRITPNGSPTISGRITGTGTLEMYNNNNTWTLTLNNSSATATNDWTGGLMINATTYNTTLALGSPNQLNGNNVMFIAGTGQRTLNLNGKSDTVGALITTNTTPTTTCVVTNGSTTACTLTLGGRDASGTFYGVLGDGGSSRAINLVKTGAGTQVFGGSLIYSGTTIINDGTLAIAQAAAFPSLSSSITVNSNATLDISAITPLSVGTLAMSNATVWIGLGSGLLEVTNFSANGSSNYVKLTTLPPVASYPAQLPVIAFTNLTAGSLNFGLAGLPSVAAGTPYAGYISNNVANNSVDIVLTAGPVGITWSGVVNSTWDTSTANWLAVGGGSTTYLDGQNVTFPDSATAKSVTLAQAVAPLSMVISNTGATAYTFGDGNSGYAITAVGSLVKQGAGTLMFDNAANNSFAGGVTIDAGTLQIGNNDANGGLAATTIINNSSLVIARNDTTTFGGSIQGIGGVSVQGGGTITLSGANTYTNSTQVTGNTLLKAGHTSALGAAGGSTTISGGSTLDINGYNLGTKNVQVSGSGTTGQGAIDNSGGSQVNALASITLTGDTTFGASANRWDLRSPTSGVTNAVLSTGGHAYNLTKIGAQAVLFVDAFVDPALANIDIQSGTLGLQGVTTGLGNPSSTVTVESSATLFTYNLTTPLNKAILLAGTLQHGNSSATISGPITLSGGASQCEASSGTTLNLNGPVSGSDLLTVPLANGGGTINFNGTNTFTGGLSTFIGTVNLNGNHATASGQAYVGGGALNINSVFGGTVYCFGALGGNGTVVGSVYTDGSFNAGAAANAAGTFTAGDGMTFDADATVTFDLSPVNTTGSGVNDYLVVTNDLTANGNIIAINLLAGSLQAGTYHLISYTGNLYGSFGGVQTASSLSQTLTLDTSVPGQVNLIVSGKPDVLKWVSQTTNNWDNAAGSTNWLSLDGNTNAPFNGGNYVLFDDAVNVVTNINVASGVIVLPAGITNNSSTNNFTINGAGSIGGGGKLVKLGGSTLTLGMANDISGVTVAGGTLSLANASALGRTNIPTVITNGGTLDIGGLNIGKYPIVISGAGVEGNGAIVNATNVSQTSALLNITMTADATIGGIGRWDLRSTATPPTNAVLSTKGQPFNLTKVGTNQVWLVDAMLDPALANINLTSGLLGIQSTTTIGNPTNTLTIYSNADLAFYQASNTFAKVIVMNDGAIMETANSSVTVGGAITLDGNGYFIGNGVAMILTNVIGGSGSLVKTNGTSQLILSAPNTYTGNTWVSGGNLVLTGNGSVSGSAVITLNNSTLDVSGRSDKTLTLVPGQTLATAGNGTINGSLTNGVGAMVSPGGIGARGALTVTNTVLLTGTTSMELDQASHTNDLLSSTGILTYGGILNVSILTGTPVNGDSFKLFKAGSYVGNFTATNLPALNAGLDWNWDPASGTLAVVQTVNLNPTNIVASVSGNQLVLSWPADHIGWQLQVQTNSLGAGLGTNWVTIPGSDTVNAITNIIDPRNGTVFYRMIH